MKKYLLLLSTLAIFITPLSANAGEYGLGVTIASNSLDTAGKEDIDNNGTTDATKNVSVYTHVCILALYVRIYTQMSDGNNRNPNTL